MFLFFLAFVVLHTGQQHEWLPPRLNPSLLLLSLSFNDLLTQSFSVHICLFFLSPDQVKKKKQEQPNEIFKIFSRESLGSADKGFVCSRLL